MSAKTEGVADKASPMIDANGVSAFAIIQPTRHSPSRLSICSKLKDAPGIIELFAVNRFLVRRLGLMAQTADGSIIM
jgi:hypothetical protein